MDSLGLSMWIIVSSGNRDGLISFFLNCTPFIYFSCLTELVRTSCTTLNKSVRANVLASF